MKKRKYNITNQFNLNNLNVPGEINEGPSLAIPGEAYTIRELLEKYTNGVMPDIHREGQYDEEPDIDNPDMFRKPDLDLSDLDLMETIVQTTQQQVEEQAKQAELRQKTDSTKRSATEEEKPEIQAKNEPVSEDQK